MQAPVCSDCVSGTLRSDVVPTGAEEVIHGLPTYVTQPPAGTAPRGTVVILTDAFGWKLRNTRALADAYAKQVPCTVYVPDFVDGHALPESVLSHIELQPATGLLGKARRTLSMLPLVPSVASFLYHGRQAVAHPRVQAFLRAVRAQQASPDAKLGVAGFCWGGLHAVLLTHEGPQNRYSPAGGAGNGEGKKEEERPLVDCSFTAHPSMLSFPKHIEDVVGPLSVANGDDDQYMGKEKMQTLVKILEGKNDAVAAAGTEGGGAKYEAVVYPGARHGFGVRADPKDTVQKAAMDGSEEQAVKWFRRWFGVEQS